MGVGTPAELKALIEQSLDADKALDIVTIDLNDQTALADYMIIASGTSSRHVNALANKLKIQSAALIIADTPLTLCRCILPD